VSATQPPVRRNDPCPCGSGKRFKDCHGKLDAAPPGLDARIAAALQHHQQGNVEAAERIYREILSREPGHAIATHYLGMATWQRGDAVEGERLMRASIAANASIPDFHHNLGLLLRDTKRTDEAILSYGRALAVDPSWFEAYNNLGLALEDAGRFDDALDAYALAIAKQPNYGAARQNRARVLLAMGRYGEGWEEYRWRLVAQGLTRTPPDPNAVRLPASLAGRRIALLSEQGIGDVLFFLRFAPELARRGATLAFRGDERLHGMLSRTGLFAGGLAAGQQPIAADEGVFVGDLPWLLEANDPSSFPPPLALSPLPERVNALRARLDTLGPSPRIALTWRAGTAMVGPVSAQLKEVPLDQLGTALRQRKATWISVQRFPRAGETIALAKALGAPVHDFSSANADLEEILALLALVDEYVGVSNANTHLRAGLGASSTVLVPFPPEWRWGIGDHSPWFPRVTVLRQSEVRSWGAMLSMNGRNGTSE
jgi:Tfp pilus assembly protein PilF